MKQHTFATQDEYVEAQRSTTLRRAEKRRVNPARHRCFCCPEVVAAVGKIHPGPVRRGLCHGVGSGEELDMLAAALGGDWIGTDIVGEMCDNRRIFCLDFSFPVIDWLEVFDLIYTNSLDHAQFPRNTLAVWFRQLAPGGVLCVEWTEWHNRLGGGMKLSDCFAADRDEYRALLGAFGRVRAEVEVTDEKGILHVVFAAE